MKKKMTYVAPETEQMVIRFESNIMSEYSSSSVDNATYLNGESWDD